MPTAAPSAFGQFSDLFSDSPDPAASPTPTPANNFGQFSDIFAAQETITPETDKAVAEIPEPQVQSVTSHPDDPNWMHAAMNAVRVFGSSAGKYIFHGLQGINDETAHALAREPHDIPEMFRLGGGDQTPPVTGTDPAKSDTWNESQAKSLTDARAAGLPDIPDPRQRLMDAITRAEKLTGEPIPHFIGEPNEPTGDRGVTRDVENLVSALKKKSKDPAVAKELAYWESDLAGGMTAQEWKDQTGDPEPLYRNEVAIKKAKESSEYWRKRADTFDQESGVDPAMANHWSARLADAGGQAAIMSMTGLIPIGGLPLMAMHGAAAAGAETRNNGGDQAQAEDAEVRSLIGLAIFGAGGKVAALGTAKLLPKLVSDPGRLTKFVAQFVGQDAANETTSRILGAWDAADKAPSGEKMAAATAALSDTTLENSTLNAVFAAMGAAHETGKPMEVKPGEVPFQTQGMIPETRGEPPATEQMPPAPVERPESRAIPPVSEFPGERSLPSQGGAMLPHEAFPVQELPIADLKLSEEVPNFKADADPTTGVVTGNELQGDYVRLGTPPIIVWERLNGDREVVSGRHRIDLARRTGEESIPQQVVREATGFSAADAARLDAEINIRDGQGTVKDYAAFFRGANITPAEAQQRSLLSRGAGRSGYAIGSDASDSTYALYANGKISDAEAASVAIAAPGNSQLQDTAIQFLSRGGKASDVGNFVQSVSTLAPDPGSQSDLFGGNDQALNAAVAMTGAAREFQRQAAQDVAVLNQARSRGHALQLTDPEAARYGIKDKSHPAEIIGALQRAKVNAEGWHRWASDPERLAQVRERAGMLSDEVKYGGPAAAAAEDTIPKLRSGENQGDLLSKQTEDIKLVGETLSKDSNDWTKASLPDISEQGSGKSVSPPSEAEPSLPFGIVPPGMNKMLRASHLMGQAVRGAASAVRSIAKFTPFRESLLKWSARAQRSSGEIYRTSRDVKKAIPDRTRREAITNWIQAGGDMAVLADRAQKSSKLSLKRGYEAALTLTPEELNVAQKIRDTYGILLRRAKAYGIEINELPDYINQIWKRQPLKEFAASSSRKLSTSIRFAKERYYDSFFDGEQSGLKPATKDVAELLPIYMNEVNNAINSKQFVEEMSKATASDGRPLLAPRGGSKTTEEGARLVFPDIAGKDTSDYHVLEQPALHQWKWVGEEDGQNILMKGDLAVHPEIYSHLKKVLGQSAIREWYRSPSENPLGDIPKATVKFLVDDVQQIGKATMLGFLSPFHQVQEGTHAIGHRVDPFLNIPKINLADPKQMDAAQHGLMLLPDRISAEQFREGLDGSTRNLLANLLGKAGGKPGRMVKEWADGYQHYLFHDYIPGLKLKTYEHILPRNSARYEKELAAGEVTEDQIKYLSAQQANAAYGHQNYADMGRSPGFQHFLQITLLAPDFLEARGRFAMQALRGKAGREQLMALATLAGVFYVGARLLNKTLDDDYHWNEPFAVIVGDRKYIMRSVPEDISRAFKDTRRFAYGRLSPLIGRGFVEGLSGVNYRGEPTTLGETFKNLFAAMIPLTVQPITRGVTETAGQNPVNPLEQLAGSLGMQISRFSPIGETNKLANDWIKEHGKEFGIDPKRAVYPVSKYQKLRYALEDDDTDRAQKEYQVLLDAGMDEKKIVKGFHQSMTHSFTGSKASDDAFYESLSEDDRATYDAAKHRREDILSRFNSMAR